MDSSILSKLRFSVGIKSAIINAPGDFYEDFCGIAGTNDIAPSILDKPQWILVFVLSKLEIDEWALKVLEHADADTMLWFAYPKKSSSIKTDITRDIGWEAVHSRGWAGVAIISIDDTWSAIRVRPQKKATVRPTSDASLKAVTGKNWEEWYKHLDLENAKSMNHQDIAGYLSKSCGLDGWWAQMVTNAYEQYLGRREKHQMTDGFQVSVSRTFPFNISKVYEAFAEENIRKSWLNDPGFEISTARKDKSIRALWVDGKTRISVDFYSKGDEKCQVVVQHLKLPSSETCEKMKAYWKENLERFVL